MTGPGGIEFLVDDEPERLPEIDAVDVGADRFPRWIILLSVAVTVAIGATALATRGGDHEAARPPLPTTVAPLPRALATPAPHDAIPLPGGAPALDVALAGPTLYVLQTDRLTSLDARTHRVLRQTELGQDAVAGVDQLVLDPAHGQGWVVSTRYSPSRIVSFTLAGLHVASALVVAGTSPVHDAVALGGRLFFSTGDGVFVWSDRGSPMLVLRTDGAASLAADRARTRLLVLVPGVPSRLSAITAAGSPAGPDRDIDMVGGSLAVTGDAIWLTGATSHGAVVQRLDPRTLQPSTDSDIAERLTPGALAVAAGESSLWLRSSGANRDVLWCRDVTGGPLASWWTLPGRVASEKGTAFVADAGYLRPVPLFSGCSG